MKKFTQGLALIAGLAALVGTIVAVKPVFASAYEWISYLHLNSPGIITAYGDRPWYYGPVEPGDPIEVKWKTHTSSDYEEYRTLYYAYSPEPSTPYEDVHPEDMDWVELTSCRNSGTISSGTPIVDTCNIAVPTSTSMATNTQLLWLRATTNYAGCGTWTLTPGASCGDIREATTTYQYIP
ncbi:hypothetical protein KBD34_04575 [Patescibacteria group bacterium]|nr:hypothetical protein [Patescibacteria group bacterium]